MPMIPPLFCDSCGSEKVDVGGVKGSGQRQFTILCHACNREAVIKGLTLGRADAPEPTLHDQVGDVADLTSPRPTISIVI